MSEAFDVSLEMPDSPKIKRGNTIEVQSSEGVWWVLIDDIDPPENKIFLGRSPTLTLWGRATLIERF